MQTARGFHVYCRCEFDYFADLGDGEFRGDAKHYVLLPPSKHPDGPVYRWLIPLPDGPLPVLDPTRAGLLPVGTERTERTERTQMDGDQRRGRRKTEEVVKDSAAPQNIAEQPADLLQLAEVKQAIGATLPTRPGERHRKLFQLARHLKALPALADLPARVLRPVVVEWHRRALPFIGTKSFADSWADFVLQWPKVRFLRGAGAVDAKLSSRACQAERPRPP